MISVRSAISRSILGGRHNPNSGAAFLQANVPFSPSSLSSDRTSADTETKVVSTSVRQFSSPAYRRHMMKKNDMESIHHVRGNKPAIGACQNGIQTPTLQVARDMGRSFSEMENEPLQVIAEMGNHHARCEVLRRHIMAVDDIEYLKACKTLGKIATKNREGMALVVLPYQVMIGTALVAGLGSIPMVFDISLAKWFNEHFVTMEVPMPSDLDTMLETGAWTWNWMEPLTGTLSFTILTLQLVRNNFLNLGIKPFTERILAQRTQNLVKQFPRYNQHLLENFVETDKFMK